MYMPDDKAASKAIADLGYEMKNPYNDGFVQKDMKDKLLRLKKELDRVLKDAPTFSNE
tara:strand:- start:512 stop:685 length:174 start_codon:yes stop_codon:yes gene_type:complete